jgi:hypothetical protein
MNDEGERYVDLLRIIPAFSWLNRKKKKHTKYFTGKCWFSFGCEVAMGKYF